MLAQRVNSTSAIDWCSELTAGSRDDDDAVAAAPLLPFEPLAMVRAAALVADEDEEINASLDRLSSLTSFFNSLTSSRYATNSRSRGYSSKHLDSTRIRWEVDIIHHANCDHCLLMARSMTWVDCFH